MYEDDAGALVFGERSQELMDAMKLAPKQDDGT